MGLGEDWRDIVPERGFGIGAARLWELTMPLVERLPFRGMKGSFRT